jgi:hypothetical protein
MWIAMKKLCNLFNSQVKETSFFYKFVWHKSSNPLTDDLCILNDKMVRDINLVNVEDKVCSEIYRATRCYLAGCGGTIREIIDLAIKIRCNILLFADVRLRKNNVFHFSVDYSDFAATVLPSLRQLQSSTPHHAKNRPQPRRRQLFKMSFPDQVKCVQMVNAPRTFGSNRTSKCISIQYSHPPEFTLQSTLNSKSEPNVNVWQCL